MSISQGSKIVASDVTSHINNKSNPHAVTASQIGAAASSHTHSNYATIEYVDSKIKGGDTGMPYTITQQTTTFDFTPSAIILLAGSQINVNGIAYNGNVTATHNFKFANNMILTNGASVSFKPTSTGNQDLNTYINGSTTLPSSAPTSTLKASSSTSGKHVFGYEIKISGNTLTISPYNYKYDNYSGGYSGFGSAELMIIALK